MRVLDELSLEELTPAGLWSALDLETRRLAALSLYRGSWVDSQGRREADAAIASAIRFREVAVRKLPLDRRIGYLTNQVRPRNSLASALLMALHLDRRKSLLGTFMDHLGVPNEEGMIDPDHEVERPEPEKLRSAVQSLCGRFPPDEIEIYLASLLAIETKTWSGLADLLRRPL